MGTSELQYRSHILIVSFLVSISEYRYIKMKIVLCLLSCFFVATFAASISEERADLFQRLLERLETEEDKEQLLEVKEAVAEEKKEEVVVEDEVAVEKKEEDLMLEARINNIAKAILLLKELKPNQKEEEFEVVKKEEVEEVKKEEVEEKKKKKKCSVFVPPLKKKKKKKKKKK